MSPRSCRARLAEPLGFQDPGWCSDTIGGDDWLAHKGVSRVKTMCGADHGQQTRGHVDMTYLQTMRQICGRADEWFSKMEKLED